MIIATDLTNCDREPIHILGRIQAHGFLLVANPATFITTHVSDNLNSFLKVDQNKLLNKNVSDFFKQVMAKDDADAIIQLIKYSINNGFDNVNPLKVSLNGQSFHLILHIYKDSLFLEFEQINAATADLLQPQIGASLSRILEGENLHTILQFAAKQIKEIIQYDRVMIYKFWEDGHGEVVAEEKNDDLESFFGLHYPASDIPKQARELYKINLTRIIADVNTPSVEILANADIQDQLDLTHSQLRAVSNIHIEYLKNMGVGASFSVSLMCRGELWGLVACHNYAPKFIDYKARQHAKLIGQVLSSSLEYITEKEDKDVNISFRNAWEDITRRIQREWSVVDALVGAYPNLLNISNAKGAALIYEEKVYLLGKTPNETQVVEIVDWLHTNMRSSIWHTNAFSKLFPATASFADTAAGVLACRISKELGEYILLFKPEVITQISWAGNPDKPVELDDKGNQKISPRKSFKTWKQDVKETSESWSNSELQSLFKLREDLVHFINLKANEIRKLNEKLKEAYDELDTFSFTISHDLKTPLASIKNYTEILAEDHPDLDESAKLTLSKIVRSADKMNALIKEVLGYSRISRQEINYAPIDMKELLDDSISEIKSAYRANNPIISYEGTPTIYGDPTMLTQVFNNLISNAVKYSSKTAKPFIKIEGTENEKDILYKIADNGVGIDVKNGGKIFELFKRMNNASSFEGTGVGLAIVKRILEKHSARIWYESELNVGTVFYLSFKKTQS